MDRIREQLAKPRVQGVDRRVRQAFRADDALVVATLPTDLIRTVMVGAEPGQPLTIGMSSADGSMHYIGLLTGDDASEGRRLSDLGLDESSKVGALFELLGVDPNQHQHGKILVTA